jgi:hypothetical protein
LDPALELEGEIYFGDSRLSDSGNVTHSVKCQRIPVGKRKIKDFEGSWRQICPIKLQRFLSSDVIR